MVLRPHHFVFTSIFAVLAVQSGALAAPPGGDDPNLRQIAGVLDYIGGDYRGAVAEGGEVLNQAEYDEQLSLAADADALAAQAGLPQTGAVRRQLAALQKALVQRRDPDAIAALCRQARATLVAQHGLVLGPSSAVSREAGARLYAEQGCGTCHGADGGADTEAARALDPQPANFLDEERMAAVSPHRAFYAISFGVDGTGMKAYAHLSDAERWSLAFHVMALRHGSADFAAGERLLRDEHVSLPRAAGPLAALTENEIAAQLAALGSATDRANAHGYLRAQAPFERETQRGSLALARRALREGVDAYRAGDRAQARQRFVSAYLDGFEPHEAGLAARGGELVTRIERAMLGVRTAAARGAEVSEVERLAQDAQALLSQAEAGRGGATAAMLGAFTIALREGLEAALLVGALLGLVRKRGAPQLARYVHAGWALAAIAGLVTWWLVGELLSGLARELAEGIAALLAAAVLLGVTHWVFGQLSARRFMGFISERLARVTGRGAAWGVLGLSFLAVYREAFEVVLFYRALLLEAGDAASRVWLGALLGLLALVATALLLKRIGQRLQPRPFMLMSGVVLALLAFALTGKGIRALQEAGVIELSALPLPDLPWIGVYASVEGLAVQGAVALLLLASALWPLVAQRLRGAPQPAE